MALAILNDGKEKRVARWARDAVGNLRSQSKAYRMAKLTYNPAIFEQPDLERAKGIILTPTSTQGTGVRWARETPYLARLLGEHLDLKSGQLVIDYGCGIGRLAKPLIEMFDCRVLGVDISTEMRGLAPAYVASPAFSIVSRRMLAAMAKSGLRADAAISVWVLQHCPEPAGDISILAASLRAESPFGVINMRHRAIPTVEAGWAQDSQDVDVIIKSRFGIAEYFELDASVLDAEAVACSFGAVYRARG